LEYHEKEVVAFQVVDTLDGDSARGDFVGQLRGAIRPKLEWKTAWHPGGEEASRRAG
jgi:lipopolysaccharide transport system ATP-binding protein